MKTIKKKPRYKTRLTIIENYANEKKSLVSKYNINKKKITNQLKKIYKHNKCSTTSTTLKTIIDSLSVMETLFENIITLTDQFSISDVYDLVEYINDQK